MQLFGLSVAVLAAGLLSGVTAIAQPVPGERSPAGSAVPSEQNSPDAKTQPAYKQNTDGRESIGYADQEQREANQSGARSAGSASKQ